MENSLTAKQKAFDTHARILANGQVLSNTLVEICKDLKSMRDERLYAELGYDSFEDYAEKAVGIKQRQAYSYISAYEKLGPTYMEENSSLGITKLALISQISSYERDDFLEEVDVENSSVRELKEKVEEYKRQNEQLTFQIQEMENAPVDETEKDRQIDELKEQIAQLLEKKENPSPMQDSEEVETLKEQIKQLEQDKVQAEQQGQAAGIKETEQKYKEKLKKKDAEIQSKIDKALADAKKEQEKLQQENEQLKQKNSSLDDKLLEAEKKAKVTGADPKVTMLKVYFDEFQKNLTTVRTLLNEVAVSDAPIAHKLTKAIIEYLQSTAKEMED